MWVFEELIDGDAWVRIIPDDFTRAQMTADMVRRRSGRPFTYVFLKDEPDEIVMTSPDNRTLRWRRVSPRNAPPVVVAKP
jgi:hypothetical protein